jgi:DNA polymerase III delta subunit
MRAASAKQLCDRLAKGKAPSLVVLLGADPYWRDLCRGKLLEALVPETLREWAVARLSARDADVEEVIGRAQTSPMLAPRQLLFVGEADAWEKGSEEEAETKGRGKGKAKGEAKSTMGKRIGALAAYLEDPASFTVLVLEAEKLDQRTRFARLLAEHALVVQLDAGGADPAQLAMEMARGLGVDLEPQVAARLAEATAGRAARMATELEKLACHAGEGGKITAAAVRELVVAEGSAEVWELAALFAEGRRGRALELIDELMRKGETPPRLVGALAWMFRKLMLASDLPAGINKFQAARELGMRPDAALTAVAHAHRLPSSRLRDGLMTLAEADDRLKSRSKDDRATMEFLVARLTRQDPPPVRRHAKHPSS